MHILDFHKIPATPNSPPARPTDFSSFGAPTGAPLSEKTNRSSPVDDFGRGEVLRKSSTRFLSGGLLLLGIFFLAIVNSSYVFASSNGVVISRLQASGVTTGTTTQEAVEIRNTTNQSIKVTGWCMYYNSTTEIGCIEATSSQYQVYINPQTSVLFVSNDMNNLFKISNPSFVPDVFFTNQDKIATSSGSLKLFDTNLSTTIDTVGWGSGSPVENLAAPALANGKMLSRVSVAGLLQDTDNNNADFRLDTTDLNLYQRGGLSEVYEPVDVCPNISGVDITPPVGYIKDTDGNCYEDVCDNIAGLQKIVPAGMYKDAIDCYAVNLKINEMLPNVAGSDTGKEYIELYNPTLYDTNLNGYYLQVGPSFNKNYPLPDMTVAAGAYVQVSDTQSGITLPNSTASLKLFSNDGQLIDQSESYDSPADNFAWALFTDSWRYTNNPTPGSQNIESVVNAGLGSGDEEACPVGKYRNPDTNRCKTIESDEGLKPCAVDQIRNPETNRCRSIFSSNSSLTPCKAGQTRNPETNRCRNTAVLASTLKPCSSNQERNPTTNRCRNKVGTQTAIQKIKDVESEVLSDKSGWFLAGSAGLGLVGYGVAEWRSELANGFLKLKALLGKNPPTD